MIGGTFRAFANAYIETYDIEKAREHALAKVQAMTDAQFARFYPRVGLFIQDLPPGIKKKYKLVPMSRQRAIALIKTLQKKDLQEMVNSIPDSTVSMEFDRRVQRLGQKIDPGDFLVQVAEVQQEFQDAFDKILKDPKKAKENKKPE